MLTDAKFNELLIRLRQQGYLSGLGFTTIPIFVEEEHYGWKSTLHTDAKRVIARKAGTFVRSGSTIVLDAGSRRLR